MSANGITTSGTWRHPTHSSSRGARIKAQIIAPSVTKASAEYSPRYGHSPSAATSFARSGVPEARCVRTNAAVATTSKAMGSMLPPRRHYAPRLLQVDDEEADQLFEVLRRAHDLAADAGDALAVRQLDVGDVAHFEVDFDRLVQRVADERPLEPGAGANRDGGVRHQDAGAVEADVDHLGVERQHAHAHFAAHGRLRRYRDAGAGAPLLHRDHDARQRRLDAGLADVHGRMRVGGSEGELSAAMVANQRELGLRERD